MEMFRQKTTDEIMQMVEETMNKNSKSKKSLFVFKGKAKDLMQALKKTAKCSQSTTITI